MLGLLSIEHSIVEIKLLPVSDYKMARPGEFINLLEKHEELSDKKTKKAEQKSIIKSEYIPPPGHISFLRQGVTEDGVRTCYLIFHNGVSWHHGRTWDFAEDWFCLPINWSSESVSTEDLQHVQSFHVTSKASGAAMENCSTSFGYVQAAAVDLSEDYSEDFIILKFGGQSTETAITSNRLEIISGPNDFDGPLHCQAYRSEPRVYKEYKLPTGSSEDLDFVQIGSVPSSRCGHSLGKLSSNLLVCTGGLSIPRADKHKFHPSDSNLFLLKYPEIEWIKLDRIQQLDRTEHSMHIYGGKIYVVGGYSFRNHLASEIFPYNKVLEIEIHSIGDSFKSSVNIIEIDIMPDLGKPFLTNMCSVGCLNNLYLFGGYSWPTYDPVKQNMYELCPPFTSHNKRPQQVAVLVVLDLEKLEIRVNNATADFATADGTLQVLSTSDNAELENLLIVGGSGQRLDLFSTFDFALKVCDINAEYGGCVVTLATKNKDLLECSGIECNKVVHIVCDKYTRGLSKMTSDRYVCPVCADYDPVTKKKRVKSRRGGRSVRRGT